MPKLIATNITKDEFEKVKASSLKAKKGFDVEKNASDEYELVEPSTLCMYGMKPSDLPEDYVRQELLWQNRAAVERFYGMAYGMMETLEWTCIMLSIVACGVGILIAQFVDDAADSNYDMDLTGIAFMTMFVCEVSARMFVVERLFRDIVVFFNNPFNCLDLFATIVDVIINILATLANYGTFGRTTRTLRILRILRLLRLVRLLRCARLVYILVKKRCT